MPSAAPHVLWSVFGRSSSIANPLVRPARRQYPVIGAIGIFNHGDHHARINQTRPIRPGSLSNT